MRKMYRVWQPHLRALAGQAGLMLSLVVGLVVRLARARGRGRELTRGLARGRILAARALGRHVHRGRRGQGRRAARGLEHRRVGCRPEGVLHTKCFFRQPGIALKGVPKTAKLY